MDIAFSYEFIILLGMAAFLAGMVDAVVGGGGLIQLPALFAALPQTAPATLIGTNKLAAIWGTMAATGSYVRRVRIPWSTAGPAALVAFFFSFLGAYTVTQAPAEFVRKALPFILLVVALYTYWKKDFGHSHTPSLRGRRERFWAMAVGAGLGFYDGLFGPGTGSFFMFVFVRFFGFDFLNASAVSKIVNLACNLSALLWFGYSGHLLWQLGLTMAVMNVAGSVIGVHLAIRYGSGFVRKLFLVVVCALILKTAFDAFLRG